MTVTNKDREARLAETARQIVNQLDVNGGSEHFWVLDTETSWRPVATRQGDGVQIAFSLDPWRDRIEVTPNVPTMPEEHISSPRHWGVVPHDAPPIHTFVAFGRPAHQAASQIERKVIEPYAPLLPRIEAKRRERWESRNDAQKLAHYIAAKLGTTVRDDNIHKGGYARVYVPDLDFPGFEIRSSNCVQVNGMVEPHIARRIAALLSDIRKERKGDKVAEKITRKQCTKPAKKSKANGKKPPQTAQAASA